MKLNKKGFTVVELLASFSLTMIIVVFLFEILIELKDLYYEASVKTEVIQKQSLLVSKIRNTLDTNDLSGITCSGETCTFNFNDISPIKLEVNSSSNTIIFNDEKTKFPSDVKFKSYEIETCPISSGKPVNDLGQLDGITAKNCYFSFNLLLESSRLDSDYPIKIVYPFNYSSNFVSGSLSYETSNEGNKTILNCKSSEYVYTVSKTGTYKIELLGATGGSSGSLNGGLGAYTSGEIYLTSGEELYFNVGCKGSKLTGGVSASVKGGYNGGGDGTTASTGTIYSGGGGGATDVRYGGNTLNDRIMVAAGGSGASNGADAKNGTPGGSLIAENNAGSAKGATQTSGGKAETGGKVGTFGVGGNATTLGSGGGGGYYGGTGGTASGTSGTTGTGGSSYISGYLGSNSITSSSSQTPTNASNHYSGKVFYNSIMYSGDKVPSEKTSEEIYSQMAEELKSPGDGYAIISYESSGIPESAKIKSSAEASYDLSNTIFWFDGIDNDGSGIHNYKLSSWRDAISAKTISLSNAKWNKEGLSLSSSGSVNINATKAFSMSLVFSLETLPSSTLYLVEGLRGVYITSAGKIGFSNGTDVVEFDYQISNLNVKNYITISGTGSQITLYANGESVSTKTLQTSTSSSYSLKLSGKLSGILNKLMIYNDNLSLEEVKNIYEIDKQRFSPIKNNIENEKLEYRFSSDLYDKNKKTVMDLVNNKITGEVSGDMEVSDDALNLTGSNFIKLKGDVNYRYSIILAVKATSYSGTNPYLTSASTYPSLYLNSTSSYKYAFNAQGVNSNFNSTFKTNKLEHIILTYDGSNVNLYIDGILKSSLSTTTDPVSVAQAYIGKNFVGKLYRYAMIDRVLTNEEIKEIYEYDFSEFK